MGTRTMAVVVAMMVIASTQPADAQYRSNNNGGLGSGLGSGLGYGYSDPNVTEWRRMQSENQRQWRQSEQETLRMRREQERQQRAYGNSLRYPQRRY